MPPNPPQTLNGQKWLLNMMKAFHSHEMFDGMKFLELWINYVILKWGFFETKFETAMNIVETVLNKFAKTQIQNKLKENKWVPEKYVLRLGLRGGLNRNAMMNLIFCFSIDILTRIHNFKKKKNGWKDWTVSHCRTNGN